MDKDLLDFINNYIYLADVRNVSFDNPITMSLQPDSREFLMVVGFSEPSFSQIPYNVLWIVYDDKDPWHKKLYRRTDHNTSSDPTHAGKKYTWEEITAFDQIYAVDQFYRNVNLTPAHELGISWANVGAATEEIAGTVLVTQDASNGEPVAVSGTHPALTDARTPTAHNHPDFPRTMTHIKGFYSADDNYTDLVNDDEFFVSWDKSQIPENGALFFLTGNNPNRPNEWYGEWRVPKASDVLQNNPHITSVNVRIVNGPAQVSDNSSLSLAADSLYDDSSTVVNDPTARWTIAANAGNVTINPLTGVLNIPDLSGDLTVTVTATADDKYWPGDTAQGNIDITIRDLYTKKTLTSLEILGPDRLDEKTSAQYQVRASYDDGSNEIVTPATFVGNNDRAATLSGDTLTALDIATDDTVTLTATYSHEGNTLTANKTVTIVAEVVPVSLAILGPSSMNELANIDLQAQVTYSDSSTSIVLVADSTWTFVSTPSDITVTPASNKVNYESTADIDSDQTFTVKVDTTVQGQALSATKDITVVDTTVPKVPQSLRIVGPVSINEQTADHEYTFEVTYTDSTTATVNATAGTFATSNTTLSRTTDFETDSSSNVIKGKLEALTDIISNQQISLSASYTENSTQVDATLAVTIVANPPVPTALEIQGPTQMNELTSIDLQAEVTLDNGTKRIVSGSDSADSVTWTFVTPVTGVTDAEQADAQRFTSATDLPADADFEVRAEVTIQGTTVHDTHTVTVKHIPPVPSGLEIIGPTEVNEGANANFTFRATYTNNTTADIDPVDIVEVNNSLAASITQSGVFTASQVNADTPVTITARHLLEGVTITDTHIVTVKDIPVPTALEIKGQTSVAEGGNFNYTFEVTYSNGTKQTVAAVDTASASAATTSFATDGTLTTGDITTDVVTTLTANVTVDGVPLADTLDVTVTADPIPASLEIKGVTTAAESTNETFTFEVTMSDGSKKTVAAKTFVSDKADATITNVGTGAVTFGAVSSDTAVVLTATYEEQGITVNDTHNVTITDTVVPTSIEIRGATSVDEGATSSYTFRVTMSDSTTKDVTPASAGATLGSFNVSGAFAAPNNVTSDSVSTLSASYTEQGVTVSDTHDVTINNAVNRPTSLAVTGANTINEGATEQLVATVTYEDGTTQVVTGSSSWTRVSGAGATINASTGLVTADANVTSDTAVRFKASFTSGGVTVEGNHDMTVDNSNNRLTALAVTGSNSVDEGGSALNLVATATFEDGSTQNVTVPSTWSIVSGNAGGSVNGSGVFTPANNVAANTVVRVQASYTVGGITRTDTHDITVSDVPVPASIAITGLTEVNEGATNVILTATMTRTNSSTANVSTDAKATWSIDAGPGSINGNVYTPPTDVPSDASVTIRVSYTDLGVTVVDTHSILIKNVASAGYGPRWGIVPEVALLAGYDDAFMASLSNNLTGVDGEKFRAQASSSNYLYIAVPDSTGWLQLQEEGTGTPGGFDGATDLASENRFVYDDGAGDSIANANQVFLFNGSTNIGGLRVEIGGQGYRIYRKVTTRSTPYDVTVIKYGTPNRKSQFDT